MRDPQSGWGSWPDDGDPIGVASARLLALDVERSERLAVLRLLGILLDHAGPGGVVRADPAVIAGEFRLAGTTVDEHVALLRRVGVLTSAEGGLRIVRFDRHRSTGLPDGEALALIAGVLDGSQPEPADDQVPEVIDLTAADAAPAPPADAPAGAPIETLVERGVESGTEAVEAAAERVLVGAAAGGGPTAPEADGGGTRTGGGARGRRSASTPALALLTGLVLVLSGVFARPGSAPVDLTQLAGGGPVTTIVVPSSLPRSFVPSSDAALPGPPASPGAAAPGDDTAGDAPGTQDQAASAAPAPESTGPVATQPAPCPDLVPEVSGVVARVEPADLDAVLGTSPWVVVVEGAVLGGAEPATVSSLPVRVALSDGSQITGEAIAAPVTIGPGRLVRWEMRAQTVSIAAPAVTIVTAGPPVSQWLDDARAAACPIA